MSHKHNKFIPLKLFNLSLKHKSFIKLLRYSHKKKSVTRAQNFSQPFLKLLKILKRFFDIQSSQVMQWPKTYLFQFKPIKLLLLINVQTSY